MWIIRIRAIVENLGPSSSPTPQAFRLPVLFINFCILFWAYLLCKSLPSRNTSLLHIQSYINLNLPQQFTPYAVTALFL